MLKLHLVILIHRLRCNPEEINFNNENKLYE